MRQDGRSPRRALVLAAASCWLATTSGATPPVEIFARREAAALEMLPAPAAPQLLGPMDASGKLSELDDPAGLAQPAERGVSPFPSNIGPRNESMELVAQQADAHTRRGFELAGRRAYYSAREEFIQALRTLSQAQDVQFGVHSYSDALAAGMRALDEAKDFVPRGAGLEANLNVAMIVTAHDTPVYRIESVEGVTALVARQRYYTYAREQLGVCSGWEVAGSMALHGLGKLHAAMAAENRGDFSTTEAEAMVFYQAALLIAPDNPLAANDLGVMLAKKGSWSEARDQFARSVVASPSAQGWANLARAYKELGDTKLAADAAREAERLAKLEARVTGPKAPSTAVKVEWVRPDGMTAAANEQFLNNRQASAKPTPASPPPAQTREAGTIHWPWQRGRETK